MWRALRLVLATIICWASFPVAAQIPGVSPAQMQRMESVMLDTELVMLPPVQKELALTNIQKDLINGLVEAMQQEMAPIVADMDGASPEEMMEQMPGFFRQFEAKARQLQGKVDQTLDDKQRTRRKQISWQVRGNVVLLEDEVMDALKLSDTQRRELETVNDDVMKKRQKLSDEIQAAREGGGSLPSDIRDRMKALEDELSTRLLDVLTAAQKQAYQRLKGPKFYMSGPPRAFQ